jgi:UDP:flavonoid glycosyltransferase YjiC (YdhE family)
MACRTLSALHEATNDPRYRSRATEISAVLAAEDGCGAAVKSFRNLVNDGIATGR